MHPIMTHCFDNYTNNAIYLLVITYHIQRDMVMAMVIMQISVNSRLTAVDVTEVACPAASHTQANKGFHFPLT